MSVVLRKGPTHEPARIYRRSNIAKRQQTLPENDPFFQQSTDRSAIENDLRIQSGPTRRALLGGRLWPPGLYAACSGLQRLLQPARPLTAPRARSRRHLKFEWRSP